ncbi:Ubiquinone biosynthesis monooxygenase COQ6, mitochondrial [Sphaceloma murrayae]|uniref:Ubiquinone biosynthesis monooxygenase COQ6, mitochondrial n=1 Tax=Sphaceloma murrayae TaxID=2082308 RepID=A0A2K1QLN6_9PEZI|nr:Ubiquinone biosynthesis monooxygenase COQ6, mitochondrial [Sphaceloma murrayae]
MDSKSKRIRVAIVGGGIGGLCLAIGLVKQPHLDVVVFESIAGYKDIGAGLALHQNALKAMDLISPSIKDAYFSSAHTISSEANLEMSTKVLLASGPQAGALVAELGKAKGRSTIARSDLLSALYALLPPSRVHFSKRLSSITPNPDDTQTLTFTDSATATADCVLGADGLHSHVRAHILGPSHPAVPPQNHDKWQIYRTLVPMSVAKEYIAPHLLSTVPILCGPKGHINIMPLHRGADVSAGVAVRGAHVPGQDVAPELRLADFEGYTPEARRVVELVARDTSASWAAADHDHAPTYVRDNVGIMGDAAHTSMPFAGNGAGQAIEDSAVLCALFGALDSVGTGAEVRRGYIPLLLKAYDAVRRPRSQKVVELARDFGRLYGFALEGYGDDVQKMRGFFKERAAFTNNVDLKAQNQEAVDLFWKLVGMERGGWEMRERSDSAQGSEKELALDVPETVTPDMVAV